MGRWDENAIGARAGDADVYYGEVLGRLLLALLWVYYRLYHRFQVVGAGQAPRTGPFLALVNHVSLLDTPAFLLAAHAHPDHAYPVKAELFRIPGVGLALRSLKAFPVARAGRDLGAIRQILERLRRGGIVCIAAEGTRSRTGRLGPVDPVLARLSLAADVPIVPMVVVGSYEALPPGARFPRPKAIRVVVGEPFSTAHFKHAADQRQAAELAAAEIQKRLAALLPPDLRPLADTPPLRRR